MNYNENITINKIDEQYIGLRIDSVIADILNIPRNRVQHWIKDGFVKINNSCIAKNYKLKPNDNAEITVPEKKAIGVNISDAPIKIVYEDNYLIVVDKPSNLVVHPGAGKELKSVVGALLYRKINLSNIGAPMRPGVVHRIDKNTSGLIVLAKNDESHFLLAKQFFNHTIKRKYVGIVTGHLKEENGVVNVPIGRNHKNRKVFSADKNGKSAVTHFKLIKRLNGMDLVKFELETGRTHQIRVHMSHIHHALSGDKAYGGRSDHMKRQALHAFFLGFIHPGTKKYISFYSPLPDDIKKLIKQGGCL